MGTQTQMSSGWICVPCSDTIIILFLFLKLTTTAFSPVIFFFSSPINVPRKDSFQPVGIEVPLVLTSSKAKFLCLQLIGIFVHMLCTQSLFGLPFPMLVTLQWIPFSVYLDYYFLLLPYLKLWATLYSWKLTSSVSPPLRKLRVGGVWSWWSVWMTQLASGTRHECLLGGGTKWARVTC